ncbi:MAG: hypothetical protein NZ802_06935 [Candidatus Poseidoniales archaeon]|nr:hypothetical protein [Candidatus Poseidoniales archaeon]
MAAKVPLGELEKVAIVNIAEDRAKCRKEVVAVLTESGRSNFGTSEVTHLWSYWLSGTDEYRRIAGVVVDKTTN